MTRLAVAVTVLLGLSGFALAEKEATPKSVAKAIKRGLATGRDLGVALGQAKALRATHTDKELAPVIKALGGAFKKSEVTPRWVVLQTLEELKVEGSYATFRKLLDVPKRVTGTSTRNLYYRAIHVAGALHEDAAMGDLEEVLEHEDRGIARSAAKALAQFAQIEDAEEKADLALRLVKRLAKLEKMVAKGDDDDAAYANNVIGELNKTIEKLTGESGPVTSAAWLEKLAP